MAYTAAFTTLVAHHLLQSKLLVRPILDRLPPPGRFPYSFWGSAVGSLYKNTPKILSLFSL